MQPDHTKQKAYSNQQYGNNHGCKCNDISVLGSCKIADCVIGRLRRNSFIRTVRVIPIRPRTPVVVASRNHGHKQHDDKDTHQHQAPYAFSLMNVQVIAQKGQTRQVCETGEPRQVDKKLPMIAGQSTRELNVATNENRDSRQDLEVAHGKDTLTSWSVTLL